MEQYYYLTCLVLLLALFVCIDYVRKLAFFYDAKRTIKTVVSGVGIFLLWDVLGIVFGIFFTGESRYDSGILLAPELPLEEIFFLTSLVYMTLLLIRELERFYDVRRS
jgi:lycopene cyclase domain-containing protein